jgi:hypothetical protein
MTVMNYAILKWLEHRNPMCKTSMHHQIYIYALVLILLKDITDIIVTVVVMRVYVPRGRYGKCVSRKNKLSCTLHVLLRMLSINYTVLYYSSAADKRLYFPCCGS